VEQAVSNGTILRTHTLRPTWHFVHRDDLRWLLALSASRIHQGNAGMYRQTGLDAAEGAKSNRVLAGAVAGGTHWGCRPSAPHDEAAAPGGRAPWGTSDRGWALSWKYTS
jgi:hypothetical protein